MGFESKARNVRVIPKSLDKCWWCDKDTPPLIKKKDFTYHQECKDYADNYWQ